MLPDHIKEAINHYIPAMEGWLDPARGCQMAELIIDTKPEVVVEIGVFGGRSLIAQAFALRENNKGVIYGIDSWRVEDAVEGKEDQKDKEWWEKKIVLDDIHRGCMQAIWNHHLEPWVVIIRSASQHCANLFGQVFVDTITVVGGIDILYIDGSHSEVASCRDVELYIPRVRSEGYVWFDDCDWPTTQKALARMDHFCTLEKDNGNYRLYRKR